MQTDVDNSNQDALTGECAVLMFLSQPGLKAVMEEAGVISEPNMKGSRPDDLEN